MCSPCPASLWRQRPCSTTFTRWTCSSRSRTATNQWCTCRRCLTHLGSCVAAGQRQCDHGMGLGHRDALPRDTPTRQQAAHQDGRSDLRAACRQPHRGRRRTDLCMTVCVAQPCRACFKLRASDESEQRCLSRTALACSVRCMDGNFALNDIMAFSTVPQLVYIRHHHAHSQCVRGAHTHPHGDGDTDCHATTVP